MGFSLLLLHQQRKYWIVFCQVSEKRFLLILKTNWTNLYMHINIYRKIVTWRKIKSSNLLCWRKNDAYVHKYMKNHFCRAKKNKKEQKKNGKKLKKKHVSNKIIKTLIIILYQSQWIMIFICGIFISIPFSSIHFLVVVVVRQILIKKFSPRVNQLIFEKYSRFPETILKNGLHHIMAQGKKLINREKT